MLRTAMVTCPTGVSPTRTGPVHRKCFPKACRRGLKSGVSLRVLGSIPAILGPFETITTQARQAEV